MFREYLASAGTNSKEFFSNNCKMVAASKKRKLPADLPSNLSVNVRGVNTILSKVKISHLSPSTNEEIDPRLEFYVVKI